MSAYKFNVLDFATATAETGSQYPQVQSMTAGYDFDAPNSIYQLALYDRELPPFEPNLNHLVLHKKAKPTDLLSNALTNSTGFLVSSRFKELLMDFKLPTHKFFPATVHHYDQIFSNYFWLQMVSDNTDFVDYQRSTFFIYKNFSKDLGDVKVESKSDFETKRDELSERDSTLFLWAKKIVMSKEFDCTQDLFHVSMFNSDFFISEKLSQAIISNSLTGIDIKVSRLGC